MGKLRLAHDTHSFVSQNSLFVTATQPLKHPLIPKAIGAANKLVEHDDPSVRELALLTLQICG